MRIVAVSGKAAAGKDSFATSVVKLLADAKVNVHIIPFAEELKDTASRLWGLDSEYLKTYDGKASMRAKLIQLGGVVREIDPYTWVDIVIRKIKNLKDHESSWVVIPDLRFLNEVYRLISSFGTDVSMVRVSAPVDLRMERMGKVRAEAYVNLGINTDISETQFDFLEQALIRFDKDQLASVSDIKKYASIVDNAGTLEDLELAVNTWLARADEVRESDTTAAMRASYMLSRKLGPEAKLIVP